MKIVQIGNHEPSFSTESHLRQTLSDMGHTVVPVQENRTNLWELRELIFSGHTGLVLYTRTWGLSGPETLHLWKQCKVAGIPTASYHLDLYHKLSRTDLWRRLFQHGITGLHNDPFWKTEFVFTVDGDPEAQAHFEQWGINHIYLRAGVYAPECYLLADTPLVHDVTFVGSYGYHSEWGYRPMLIDWLKDAYGSRFRKEGNPESTLRGDVLNRHYASSKVVVGDSLCPGFTKPGYWSDRVYETLGRGGFLIHPYIQGMEEEFTNGQHLVFYQFGNFPDLREKIDYYLEHDEEREAIRRAGHEHVKVNFTYHQRMQTLISHVQNTRVLTASSGS